MQIRITTLQLLLQQILLETCYISPHFVDYRWLRVLVPEISVLFVRGQARLCRYPSLYYQTVFLIDEVEESKVGEASTRYE